MEQYVNLPGVRPISRAGECAVLACARARHSPNHPLCRAHKERWAQLLSRRPDADLRFWCRLTGPVAGGAEVVFTGLPPLVIAEVLYGLQVRTQAGLKTLLRSVELIVTAARARQVTSLLELVGLPGRTEQQICNTMQLAVRRALSSPETERRKDVWDLTVFGYRGGLRFTAITQPWLRQAAKHWVSDDLPHRRGARGVAGTMQERLRMITWLSQSLRVQRDDHGMDPAALGRVDIDNFLQWLAHRTAAGDLSAAQRVNGCRYLRKILRDMRDLGLTRTGGCAAGMSDEFALRPRDVPKAERLDGPGRALPQQVLRQLYEALPDLEKLSPSIRNAVEVHMDTGRRPEEIAALAWDCLDVGGDGKHVLVYDEPKTNRTGRRLPITDATAAVIQRQQRLVRERFPDTATSELKLFPAKQSNPAGTRRIAHTAVGAAHRRWIDKMPPLQQPDGTEYNKADIVLYSYRHSFAQRHADAGTAPDVLRDLMGHRSMVTTQLYYRVTEKRLRTAVDKLISFQFDRHGERIWSQAHALLDHEHARMRIGAVAVPYGTCSEPSNVKAGGDACPFRFRCLGCAHFRTDPSYLPELRNHLQSLLRDRERVLAATELDSWAQRDATPSDEEISNLRQLIGRVDQAVDGLDADQQAVIRDATQALRASRQSVSLGMPRTAAGPTRLERHP